MKPAKTANIPSVRVDPELRDAAEQVLEDGESLSQFVEASVRESVHRRRTKAEFLARGIASLEQSRRTGAYVKADAVIAKLSTRLEAARTKARKGRTAR